MRLSSGCGGGVVYQTHRRDPLCMHRSTTTNQWDGGRFTEAGVNSNQDNTPQCCHWMGTPPCHNLDKYLDQPGDRSECPARVSSVRFRSQF